ncbi:endonuclease/exonuclease/phosphatase family protein [Salinimicrobium sp. TH3]|uniref:endonuclease/exonuclease/phosphatase family protein n=1 Tax=Salinimicrobium sp. TH3 TaxID=2997342 RepID=UPI0022730C70|nr:endonuclease/exonuclease/phosphatase family protein [Salinimicrobium sp. TH3]MCY2685940.1 endonuclease/exonuclease/phosphatase family protein [Salinimicrobium sp. TH3]
MMVKHLRSFFLIVIVSLSILMTLLGVLSLIHDISFWFIKILDFPRVQYLIISVLCLILLFILKRNWNIGYALLVIGLLTAIIIHSIKVSPYFFGEKVVPDAENLVGDESSVKIIIANVLVTNRSSDKLIALIDENHPDIVLAMETDDWWAEQLDVLQKAFPYKMEYPLENAYGMVLYSKLPLKNSNIKFLKHSDVPSFHTTMTLPSGQEFSFHGVHPVAPVPSSKYPDNVAKEEVALSKVGNIVAEETLPSIVAGDFNDVSWSQTTRFFEEQGKLKNVRLGRGLYNSYNANSRFLRWPLDHFFVTKEFRLGELERLSHVGSDHFPMIAEFILPSTD